jgi:heme/copper-type cytochrome/quinol oxidase subunit 4
MMKRILGDYPYEKHIDRYKRRVIPWGVSIIAGITAVFFVAFQDRGKFVVLYLVFVGLVLVLMVFTYLFLWLVTKAKPGVNKRDFFTTWGRSAVRRNIDQYFEEPYKRLYKTIMTLTYVILAVFGSAFVYFFFRLTS